MTFDLKDILPLLAIALSAGVTLGKISALEKRIEGIAADVKGIVPTCNAHGERIAKLEARNAA